MRLFVAIDLNELSQYFREVQGYVKGNARLSYTKSFHVTLKFLGEVQPKDAEKVITLLKNVHFSPFRVFLDSLGIFPAENCIRVVWISLKPEEPILELQKAIDNALKGMFSSEKASRAHITLARVKEVKDKQGFIKMLTDIKVKRIESNIKEFKLIKSTLTGTGPVYEDLAAFH